MERDDLAKEAESLLCDVGYEQFNRDHKELVYHMLILKELLENISKREETKEDWAKIKEIMNLQIEKSKTHFATEEEMMKKAGYAELQSHIREHEMIVTDLLDIKKCIDNEEDIKYAKDLQSLFLSWIFQHSSNVDMDYRGKLG
ncbi:MAG: hemerythrin domain-containing protein [Magnetococcales bacterium]|nr:hemerythrin domain-containing protein [Magnetococcales bacterium]